MLVSVNRRTCIERHDAHCDSVRYSLSVRHWRADFRNFVVAIERAGIWQFSLGGGINSFQFHGGPGVGKRARRIIENSAMAAASFVRGVGGVRRVLWLHDCFWPSSAWRLDATRVANTVESSAGSPRTAIRRVFPDPTRADNSDGFYPAGDNRGSSIAANELWTRDRFFVRLEHVRRRCRCTAWRSISYRSVWSSRHGFGCRLGELRRRSNRFSAREIQRRYVDAL